VFVEVARAGRADAIVRGTARHLVPRRGTVGMTVWTPREFVDRMRRRADGFAKRQFCSQIMSVPHGACPRKLNSTGADAGV
jgi:hypothetical protein